MEIVVQRNEAPCPGLRRTPKSSDPLPSPLPCTPRSRQREVTAPHARRAPGSVDAAGLHAVLSVAAEIQGAPLQLNVAPRHPSSSPLHPRALTWEEHCFVMLHQASCNSSQISKGPDSCTGSARLRVPFPPAHLKGTDVKKGIQNLLCCQKIHP